MSEAKIDNSNSPIQPSNPVQVNKGDNQIRNIAIVGCLVFFCLLCLCVSAVGLLLGGTVMGGMNVYSDVEKSVSTLCTATNSNLKSFYETNTSKAFRQNTSLTEFQRFYSQYKSYISDCSKVSKDGIIQTLLNGVNISYENVNGSESFTLTYPSQSQKVEVGLVKEGSTWKINSVEIL